MKSKLNFILPIIALCLCSCVKRYNVDVFEKPQVVLNSIITPDSTFKIDLYWSRKLEDSREFSRVIGSTVRLKENDALILETVSDNSRLVFDYHPKSGAHYSIEVETKDQPLLKAETTIPLAPDAECRFTENRARYHHYRLDNVVANGDPYALLLGAFYGFKNLPEGEDPYYNRDRNSQIYTVAQFSEKFNTTTDDDGATITGSNEAYWDYMMVERKNVEKVYPLTFSMYGGNPIIIYSDDYSSYTEIKPENTVFLISATKDYALYYKTLRMWQIQNSMGDIFNTQVLKIHSNIEGGLGIFAAYNQKSFIFEFNEEQ